MTRGQGIKKAIRLIETLKVTVDNPNVVSELDEIIAHLEFVGQFYL